MAAVHVPNLRGKLMFLIERHPELNSLKDLAEMLDIKVNNIYIWCDGVPGIKPPDSVPIRHLPKLCQIFNIDREAWELESFDEFKTVVGRNGWSRFCQQKATSYPEGLKLFPREGIKGLVWTEGSNQALPRFEILQQVTLALTLPPDWARLATSEGVNLNLFSQDREKTTSIVPSQMVRDTLITTAEFAVYGLQIMGPSGEQSLLALLTAKGLKNLLFKDQRDQIKPLLDIDLLHELQAERNEYALEKLAARLLAHEPDNWELLRMDYQVL